ncbi:hypothetical protein DOTSEDRAFT_75292 [Dothistroma septosporum NZE10]|uniref:PinX1-related protein 1 n=1 Tax=Dothistroma septosporum (strain NZE10 / CBS 128990) TaxID=675120 RepID=M2WKS6_DOTSN|nr:hypothetical protein DOTSEDRAFT_75292 [Dothistroma septosporum NZE10]
MGLSGVKKRSRLSQDPNNNNWSKSTTNFGHKILSKQGWKPGEYLGAENATHADHYTAANASHIRVMLREDNLGLGAQLGKGNAETFGLALFSGVLGRLNGKSDAEVQKKQDALRDAELRAYQNTTYGFMNFVRGGLLVGDKMEPPKSTNIEDIKTDGTVSERQKAGNLPVKNKTKKAKSESGDTIKEEEQERANLYAIPEKQKRRKDKKNSPEEDPSASESSKEDKAKEVKRPKKEAKKADKAAKAQPIMTEEDRKAHLKEEKRAMKLERRKRKEDKRAKRAAKQNADSAQPVVQTSAASSESARIPPPPMISVGGRHAVRHRYIMQKRMASMSANSLKEIFMLQPQAAS